MLAGYVSAARPTVGEAVAALAAEPGGPVAVVTFLLAPGLFHDKVRQTAAGWVTGPLGAHPGVAGLVPARFRAALAQGTLSAGTG